MFGAGAQLLIIQNGDPDFIPATTAKRKFNIEITITNCNRFIVAGIVFLLSWLSLKT